MWIPAVVIIICAGALKWFMTFGPGITKKQTAHILIHDSKFGYRAKRKAVSYGDAILPILRSESDDFKRLDSRNSIWVAEVLGKIKTDRATTVLHELYTRRSKKAKLTGAMGLAIQGAFSDQVGEDSFLVQTVRADPEGADGIQAMITLGWIKNPNALPCLLDTLKRKPLNYWSHAHACVAVGKIRSKTAIPVLRDCMRSEKFYALPEALCALAAMGDREGVPLAVARLSPHRYSPAQLELIKKMEMITGKNFGHDREKWQEWWKGVHSEWQLPEDLSGC